MTKKKYGIGSLIADGFAAVLAPATFGASLLISPTARNLVGDVFSGDGGSNDNTQNLTKQWEIQNKQYETQMKERKEELERLRKEREEESKKTKQNNEEIDRLRLIINDPNKSTEEKNSARSRMIILEDENRKLKDKIGKIETEIKTKEKEKPLAPSAPLGLSLPKFSAYDKAIIAGILVLIIYFLFLKDNNKNK